MKTFGEVPLDRAWTQEQPRANLRIRQTFADEADYLKLLWRERVAGFDASLAYRFASRQQLAPRSLGERTYASVVEGRMCLAKLLAGVQAPTGTTQPLAVDQACAADLGGKSCAAQALWVSLPGDWSCLTATHFPGGSSGGDCRPETPLGP